MSSSSSSSAAASSSDEEDNHNHHVESSRLPTHTQQQPSPLSQQTTVPQNKTCRLLALEVGSLKAELSREQKKRAQAVQRATHAEACHQAAQQQLHEVQYSSARLQKELDAARAAADSSNRRVQSLRQSLADAESEAQDRASHGQQQVCVCMGLHAFAGQRLWGVRVVQQQPCVTKT